jgi:hypothetical protein
VDFDSTQQELTKKVGADESQLSNKAVEQKTLSSPLLMAARH